MAISVPMSNWKAHVQTAVLDFNRAYPNLSWGTYPGHDPTMALATDGMVPAWNTKKGRALGWTVAKWIWTNRKKWNVWYIIFDGKIISETRPKRGWIRYFNANNPNPSKSHKNHVHISFYNSAPKPGPKSEGTVWVDTLDYGRINSTSVRLVQKALKITVTGNYDSTTRDAVKKFQISLGDDPKYCDGLLGGKQAVALFRKAKMNVSVRTDPSGQGDLPKPPVPPKPKPVPKPPVPPKPKPPTPVPPKPKPIPVGYKKILSLNPPGGGNWQCAAQNIKTGEWIVAHSKSRSDDKEDVILYRFDRLGKYKDKMTLPKCSHVYGMGVSDTNVIWLTWNDSSGNDVVTFQYRPNKKIAKKNTTRMHVFSDGKVDISFSPTRAWAVLRQPGYPKGYETYRRYSKSNIIAGNDKKWGKDVKIRTSSSRVVQGFSVRNEFLYVLIGLAPRSAFRIEKWSFKTGKKVSEMKLPSNIGLSEVSVKSGRKTEPEGMDGGHFFIKAGESNDRRLIVYKLNNF